MKNKFLKIGLPIIGMGAIAITAPILTSCNGDEGNNSQDTSAILANFGAKLDAYNYYNTIVNIAKSSSTIDDLETQFKTGELKNIGIYLSGTSQTPTIDEVMNDSSSNKTAPWKVVTPGTATISNVEKIGNSLVVSFNEPIYTLDECVNAKMKQYESPNFTIGPSGIESQATKMREVITNSTTNSFTITMPQNS